MTAYHGGKHRIGKYIAKEIHTYIHNNEIKINGYCEPFCGMLGVYKHIPDFFGDIEYKAGDINESVIMMWKDAQNGWIPPSNITEEAYTDLKYNGICSGIKGFIGHTCSFRGVFFDSYFDRQDVRIKSNSNNVVKISEKLRSVDFSTGEYQRYSNLKNYIIYCDPPYINGEQRYFTGSAYTDRLSFDSEIFWKWVDDMSKNNVIFISEYYGPIDEIWSHGKEKLFVKYNPY